MASVKMNSATNTHPVMKGPSSIRRNGFSTRNARIVALYQSGASPRKLRARASQDWRTLGMGALLGTIVPPLVGSVRERAARPGMLAEALVSTRPLGHDD